MLCSKSKNTVQDEGGVADQGYCNPSRGSSAAGECLGKHQGTAVHLVAASAQQAVAQLPAGVEPGRCIPTALDPRGVRPFITYQHMLCQSGRQVLLKEQLRGQTESRWRVTGGPGLNFVLFVLWPRFHA